MSLQDMTADEVIASIHNALEQELQKQHPISPSYHSGHVALSYKIGAREERERIIKIIEKRRDYDCSSALCKIHGLLCIYCKADNELIELIKGEQK